MSKPNSGSFQKKDIEEYIGMTPMFTDGELSNGQLYVIGRTVISDLTILCGADSKGGGCRVHCMCNLCGEGFDAELSRVLNGRVKSCGCKRRARSKAIYQAKARKQLSPEAIKGVWLLVANSYEADTVAEKIGTTKDVIIAAVGIHSDYLNSRFDMNSIDPDVVRDACEFTFVRNRRDASRLAERVGLHLAEVNYLVKRFRETRRPAEFVVCKICRIANINTNTPNSENSIQQPTMPGIAPDAELPQAMKAEWDEVSGSGSVNTWELGTADMTADEIERLMRPAATGQARSTGSTMTYRPSMLLTPDYTYCDPSMPRDIERDSMVLCAVVPS
jgi:hypothetical protein